MKKLLLLIFVGLASLSMFAQTADQANLGGTSSIAPVTRAVATVVDPNITVVSNGTISGAKVIISGGYSSGASGDILSWNGTLPTGISGAYSNTTGVLSLTGIASASDWQTALRSVTITSTSAACYPEQRLITFSLGDKFYNPLTNHWYEATTTTSNWANAKANAPRSVFLGKIGYLATITSAAENNFIWKLMRNDAWIGGSDDYLQINAALGTNSYTSQGTSYNAGSTTESEGKYYWVTGPEAGTRLSNGNAGNTPASINGSYFNWYSGEPNNSGNQEHVIQLYSTGTGQWNDFGSGANLLSIIEYGGSALDDNSSNTTFTRELSVSGSASGRISGGETTLCAGTNSTVLTLNGYTGTIVRWEKSDDNFYTAGVVIANTAATYTVSNLTKTTYYRAVVNSGAGCTALPTGSVTVKVGSAVGGNISALNNSICTSGVVNLTLSGQQGNIMRWERKLTSTGSWTSLTGTTNKFSESLSTIGNYFYRAVVQITDCGGEVYSPEYPISVVSGTTPVGGDLDSFTSATGNFSGTLTLTGSSGTIQKWQSSTNNGLIWTDIVNTTTSYNFTGVNATTLYRVLLQNGSCGTAYSSVGKVTIKRNPTISAFANVNKNLGDLNYTIAAPNSNSTGSFTYTSSNLAVATISGVTVTLVGAGTSTITATQAADDNYNSGIITSTLTVINPNITISTASLPKFIYCANSVSAEKTFTVSGSDLSANIVITAPTGFEVSKTSGSGFANSVSIPPISNNVASTTIYVRVASSRNGNLGGNITLTSGSLSQNVAVVGVTNNALGIDGLANHVDLGDNIENFTSFSAEAWVYWKGSTTAYSEIFTKDAVNSFAITSGNNLHANFGDGTSWIGSVNSTTLIPINKWSHVTVTRSTSGLVKLYINGVLDESTTTNNAIGDNNINRYIGAKLTPGGTFGYFDGAIDEVRVWNTEITSSDILSRMNSPLTGNESGLLAYYDFNNGIANGTNTGLTTLKNGTSTLVDGTLSGFALAGTSSNWVTGYFPQITGANTVIAGAKIQLAHAYGGGTWSSSNNTIATVSANGLVTGVLEGNATITYASCNNSTTAVISVTDLDTDGDGISNATDTDDDGDGIPDTDEKDCSAATGVSQTLNPANFKYVVWNSFAAGVLRGTITVGSTVVNVSVTNSSNSIIDYGNAPFCGTTYWAPVPTGNGAANSFRSYTQGQHRFVFDQPVNNPRFFLSSLNKTLDLSAPGTLLKSNGAFTGLVDGTTGTVLPGNEGCGTVSFTGNVTEVSFTGREREFYCDFSLGIADIANYSACVDQDTDGDGIVDRLDTDSDGDGVTDGQEVTDGTNPRLICSFILASQTLTPSATWNTTDCDGDGVDNATEKTKGANPLVRDSAPVITGPNGSATTTGSISTKSIPDNTTAVYTFTANKTVTWSLTGEDNSKFTITSNGVLTFVNPPSFRNPTDGATAGSNSYVVVITATDVLGFETTQTLTVYILDPTCNNFAATDFIINGNASLSGNEITLTPNAPAQSGSVWNQYKLSLNKDFNISTKVYLGNSNAGADGIAFVLQNQSVNAGSSGGGLGYAGISPSFAVEFDTYNNGSIEPASDHIALIKNGVADGAHNNIAAPFETEMEDGIWHDVRFLWNATSKNFQVYYDNVKRFDVTYDIKANIFPTTDYVYWGFTGATGGSINLQKVQLPEYCYVQQASISLKPGTNNPTAAKSICLGSDVVLESSLATSYQWYKDGAIISGETNRTLTVSQSGSYTVETLSLSFTTVSEPTVVTVNLLPAISYPNANYSFVRGDLITNLIATNTVAVSVSSYTITPTLPAGLTLNASNGTISGTPTATKVATDYTVTANTAAGCSNTYRVNLVVINDTPPATLSYSPNPQTLRKGFVMNNMLPTSTGGKVITYTISPSLPAGVSINSTSGIISGTLTATLTGSQVYVVTATNSGGSTTANVTLIFNSPPTDISISADKIDENKAANSTVGTFSTTDPDTGDTFTYTLIPGTGDSNNASFTITGNTLTANAAFNFETKTSYSILVRSTDAGGLFFDKIFTISVLNVNETPTNIALSASSINENNAIGANIGTLSTTDVDAGDTFTYTLVSGTGITDNASFTITGNTLKANAAFNFEAKTSYSILVRTTDAGGLFFDKAFTISILNVNETPTNIALSANSINENNAIGANIGTLSTTDVDAGDTFTYTLVSGTGITDNASFTITGNTLKANAAFNFEAKTSYSVLIRTTDAGGLFFDKAFTISILNVNETPTDIGLSFNSIYENNAVGAPVATLSTTDVDAGDTFTYTLVSGDVTAFNIVGNKLNAAIKYNYNTKTSYTVVIKTTDAGGLSYQKSVTINILKAPVASGIGNEIGTNTITAASNNVTISKGFSAQLNVTGSNLVTYSWSPSTGLNTTTSATPIANPTVTTTYTVTVTNSMGLTTVVYVTVTVVEDYNIKPHNMLTPNGDGINDNWVIENIDQYPNNEVIIFDRAGRKIYSKKGYSNDWDGKYNGQDLAVDTYYYIIIFSPGIEPRKGFISIIR